jgi:hypothetical protein
VRGEEVKETKALAAARAALRDLDPIELRNVLRELVIDARAAEESQSAHYRAAEYQRKDADTEECIRRRQVQQLRKLADQQEQIVEQDVSASNSSLRDYVRDLRQRADALDPPKATPRVVRETLHLWIWTEWSNGNASGESALVPEPPRELTAAVWASAQQHRTTLRQYEPRYPSGRWGWSEDYVDRVRVLRRHVFAGLAGQFSCEVFNSRGLPEHAAWSRALAMFEEFLKGDYPF